HALGPPHAPLPAFPTRRSSDLPAIDLKAPRGSTAVAQTAQTRKNVSTISISSPRHWLTPPTLGTAPSDALCRKIPRRRSAAATRSEEHTSELQSRVDLVCRLLL